MVDAVFIARLASVLTDNKFDRKVRSTRGKIDMRGLPRVSVGARNVFTQKKERKNKQYSVVIDCDESGSMERERRQLVVHTIVPELVAMLEKVGVRVGVIGTAETVDVHKTLNERYDRVKLILKQKENAYIVKNSDGSISRGEGAEKEITMNGKSFIRVCGTDNVGGAKKAMDMLAKESHGKIYIHFTDGSIRCDYPSYCKHLQGSKGAQAFRAVLNQHKDVVAVGFGIGTSGNLPEMFPEGAHHQLKSDASDMREQFISFLERAIKRG